MGAFDDNVNNRTITIPESPEQGAKWGWDPHETVSARIEITADDEAWVNNQALRYFAPQLKKGVKAKQL